MENRPCVFSNNDTTVVRFVDYLLIVAEVDKQIDALIRTLSRDPIMKDLGKPASFLCKGLNWVDGSVLRDQRTLIKNLLKETGMVQLVSWCGGS